MTLKYECEATLNYEVIFKRFLDDFKAELKINELSIKNIKEVKFFNGDLIFMIDITEEKIKQYHND